MVRFRDKHVSVGLVTCDGKPALPSYFAAAVIHVDQHKCDGLIGPHARRLLVGDRFENRAGEAPFKDKCALDVSAKRRQTLK